MGYVKSKIIIKPHCENCHNQIGRCEYCKSKLEDEKELFCLDDTSYLYPNTDGHCCSKECYKKFSYMKKYYPNTLVK